MGGGSVREESPGPYQNGALLAVVPMELHHGLEREIADDVTVEDEEGVCGLREQVTGQGQGSSCGRGTNRSSFSWGVSPGSRLQAGSYSFPGPKPQGANTRPRAPSTLFPPGRSAELPAPS